MAALVAVLVVAQSGGSDGNGAVAGQANGDSAVVGQEAAAESTVPAVTLVDFDDNPVALADYLGKPLVINFWASWCVPCLAEMPGFERIYQNRKADIEFLGINLQDEPAAAQDVIRQTGITYPVARDTDGAAFVAFRGRGMPTTVLVSADGRVLESITGGISAATLDAMIVSVFGF